MRTLSLSLRPPLSAQVHLVRNLSCELWTGLTYFYTVSEQDQHLDTNQNASRANRESGLSRRGQSHRLISNINAINLKLLVFISNVRKVKHINPFYVHVVGKSIKKICTTLYEQDAQKEIKDWREPLYEQLTKHWSRKMTSNDYSQREFRVEMWFSLDLNTNLCFTVRWSPIEDQTSRVCSSGFQLLSSETPRQHNLFQPWTNTSDSTIISRRWINWIKCISLTSHGGRNPSWSWSWNGLFLKALLTLIHDCFNILSACSRLTEVTAL